VELFLAAWRAAGWAELRRGAAGVTTAAEAQECLTPKGFTQLFSYRFQL